LTVNSYFFSLVNLDNLKELGHDFEFAKVVWLDRPKFAYGPASYSNNFSAAEHQKLLNLNLKTAECNSRFLLVDIFLEFAQKSFEKWQAAICRFSEEFCENLGSVLTIGRK
jgi:hypothetical protein